MILLLAKRVIRPGAGAAAIGGVAALLLAALAPTMPAGAQSTPTAAPSTDLSAFLIRPAPSGPGSLTGLWVYADYKSSHDLSARERILLDENGQMPPLLPAARALLEQRIKDSDAGRPYANTLSLCLPGGVPQIFFAATSYPLQIIETPTQVITLMDEQNHFRYIALDGKHADDPDPTYFGDAVGHWVGGDLVVDTIGLTARTSLDQIGMPHSEAMRVTERYHRVDRDTLQVEITIDDPKTFAHPWKVRSRLRAVRPDVAAMPEYICENNRNTPDASGRQTFQPK